MKKTPKQNKCKNNNHQECYRINCSKKEFRERKEYRNKQKEKQRRHEEKRNNHFFRKKRENNKNN